VWEGGGYQIVTPRNRKKRGGKTNGWGFAGRGGGVGIRGEQGSLTRIGGGPKHLGEDLWGGCRKKRAVRWDLLVQKVRPSERVGGPNATRGAKERPTMGTLIGKSGKI